MIIPAVASFIFSLIFFNLNHFPQSELFLPSSRNQPVKMNLTFTAVTPAGFLPKLRFYQLPQLDQPGRRPLPVQSDQRTGREQIIPSNFAFTAQNVLAMDRQNNNLLLAKRPDRPWPIASITKLFTAYVFLDYNPGWEANLEIKTEDRREGGKIYLFAGDKVTVKDLFYFSLVGSDNTATAALVRAAGLSEAEFVQKINDKAKELGFKNTRIVEPVGLSAGNISTAREVALFAKIALAKEEISRASLTKIYEFYTKQGRKKVIASTNELLSSFPAKGISLRGGKTGHVDTSGYCLVSQFNNQDNQGIIVVVLGAASNDDRFDLTKKIVEQYYVNKPQL